MAKITAILMTLCGAKQTLEIPMLGMQHTVFYPGPANGGKARERRFALQRVSKIEDGNLLAEYREQHE